MRNKTETCTLSLLKHILRPLTHKKDEENAMATRRQMTSNTMTARKQISPGETEKHQHKDAKAFI